MVQQALENAMTLQEPAQGHLIFTTGLLWRSTDLYDEILDINIRYPFVSMGEE